MYFVWFSHIHHTLKCSRFVQVSYIPWSNFDRFPSSSRFSIFLIWFRAMFCDGFLTFNMLNFFFKIKILTWDNCIDICTNGEKAIVRKSADVVSRIKEVKNNCINSHCILHRQGSILKMYLMGNDDYKFCVKILDVSNHYFTIPK